MALGRLGRSELGAGDQWAFLGVKGSKHHVAHGHFLRLTTLEIGLCEQERASQQV